MTLMGLPPCLLVNGEDLISDASWTCSCNFAEKSFAAAYPSAGAHWFPHQESLPTTRLSVPFSKEGIADFGCVLLGRPLLPPEDFVGLGESMAETLATHTPAKQRPLFEDRRERAF